MGVFERGTIFERIDLGVFLNLDNSMGDIFGSISKQENIWEYFQTGEYLEVFLNGTIAWRNRFGSISKHKNIWEYFQTGEG